MDGMGWDGNKGAGRFGRRLFSQLFLLSLSDRKGFFLGQEQKKKNFANNKTF